MLKSNFFGPGAKEVLNGTTIHSTSSFAKPSSLATAYATALSNPSPERGSLTFHGAFGVPPNQGGNAGLSVPTVSCPSLTRFRSALSHEAAVAVVAPDDCLLEPPQPVARNASAATSKIARDRATHATLPRGYFGSCASTAMTFRSRTRTRSSSRSGI